MQADLKHFTYPCKKRRKTTTSPAQQINRHAYVSDFATVFPPSRLLTRVAFTKLSPIDNSLEWVAKNRKNLHNTVSMPQYSLLINNNPSQSWVFTFRPTPSAHIIPQKILVWILHTQDKQIVLNNIHITFLFYFSSLISFVVACNEITLFATLSYDPKVCNSIICNAKES